MRGERESGAGGKGPTRPGDSRGNLSSTDLASMGEVPADVRPDLGVVEVLLRGFDHFLDLVWSEAADVGERWDEAEEEAVLVHPAKLANGEEERV